MGGVLRITPEQLRPRTDRAVTRVDAIYKNWRWARRLGRDRLRVSDEAKVRGASSNEVESIALGQQLIRDLVRRGEQSLFQGTVEIEKADYYFQEALDRSDNRSPEVKETDLFNDPNTKEPLRWVSKRERRRLTEAQDRRAVRGEDVP